VRDMATDRRLGRLGFGGLIWGRWICQFAMEAAERLVDVGFGWSGACPVPHVSGPPFSGITWAAMGRNLPGPPPRRISRYAADRHCRARPRLLPTPVAGVLLPPPTRPPKKVSRIPPPRIYSRRATTQPPARPSVLGQRRPPAAAIAVAHRQPGVADRLVCVVPTAARSGATAGGSGARGGGDGRLLLPGKLHTTSTV
jgi:hypothetical protein